MYMNSENYKFKIAEKENKSNEAKREARKNNKHNKNSVQSWLSKLNGNNPFLPRVPNKKVEAEDLQKKLATVIQDLVDGEGKDKKVDYYDWTKKKKWPRLELLSEGSEALLHMPEDQRTPLLLSQLKLVWHWILAGPFVATYLRWCSFRHSQLVSHIVVVIVDGLALEDIQDLNTSTKKIAKYHQAMLDDGTITLYNGPHQISAVTILNDKRKRDTDERETPNGNYNYNNKKIKTDHNIDSVNDSESARNGEINTIQDTHLIADSHISNSNNGELYIPTNRSNDNKVDVSNSSTTDDSPCTNTESASTLSSRTCSMLSTLRTWLPRSSSVASVCVAVAPLPCDEYTSLVQELLSVPTIIRNEQSSCMRKGNNTDDSEKERNAACRNVEMIHSDAKYWPRVHDEKLRKNILEDKFDRTTLLMTYKDMLHNFYPMPEALWICSNEDIKNDYSLFIGTKASYERATKRSPMFGVDCEFVQTYNGKMSLASISIVNEANELVYHTLVKPHLGVVNYLSRYSGITEDMLQNVVTRLADVQDTIRARLPPDAILVGQSLSNDLEVMQMYHPFVIDTALQMNISRYKDKCSSLKALTYHFLNRHIQEGKFEGHDPTEDAVAALNLIQLKLQHGEDFGIVASSAGTKRNVNVFELKDVSSSDSSSSQRRAAALTCAVLTTAENEAEWRKGVSDATDATVTVKEDNAAVVAAAAVVAMEKGFTVAHLQADPRLKSKKVKPRLAALTALDEQLSCVYHGVAERGLFLVLCPGRRGDAGEGSGSSGFSMICFKETKPLASASE